VPGPVAHRVEARGQLAVVGDRCAAGSGIVVVGVELAGEAADRAAARRVSVVRYCSTSRSFSTVRRGSGK
jgi:hypothetical protein